LKSPFEIFLGLRYLRSKRQSVAISVLTLLSIIGVAIGVMALIVVLSVMNGFDQELQSKIVGLNAHVIVSGRNNKSIQHYQSLITRIKKIPDVKFVGPYIESEALATSNRRSLGIIIWGIDPNHPRAIANLNKYLFETHVVNLNKPKTLGRSRTQRIFLGNVLAHRLEVNVGDDVILFLPTLQPTPLGLMPKAVKFQVVGIFKTGMYDYDATFSYVSLKNAQKMYGLGKGITGIAIKVNNINQAPLVAREIRKIFHNRYQVQDWQMMNHNLLEALQTEKWVMGIILSLIVVVAALNIINPLTMMVIEKTKEIGILKAMGASNFSITIIFIFEGLFIGIVGTLLGAVLGFILCEIIAKIPIPMPGGGAVYYINRLPVKVQPFLSYFLIPILSIILCFLATLYPSWQAAKLEPIDAIRYE
jgi:lipoprotein-releasing system permease protein